MENIATNKSVNRTSRHVLAAQKAQLALVKSKTDELRRRAEKCESIKEDERNAAEILSRAKYLERKRFKDREYKFATTLGLMLLIALRANGLHGMLFSAKDIESQWSTEKCIDLLDFLKSSPTDFLDAISKDFENTLTQSQDIERSEPPSAYESSAFGETP